MFADWKSPAAVFEILKQCTTDQPCDINGIEDYQHIDEAGGIQWPLPAGTDDVRQERRLFEDGRFYHADGRAQFLFEEPRPLPERTNEQYPLLLLTGRGTASQWHTETRTRQSAVLRKLYPQDAFVEINPDDAKSLGVTMESMVEVISQRGRAQARAFLTHAVQRGQVFMAMHYEAVNRLTFPAFDPYSGQPAYKASAVRVARIM